MLWPCGLKVWFSVSFTLQVVQLFTVWVEGVLSVYVPVWLEQTLIWRLLKLINMLVYLVIPLHLL